MLYLCTRFSFEEHDSLAQQVEHIPFKDGVVGSSPTRITSQRDRFGLFFIYHFFIYHLPFIWSFFIIVPFFNGSIIIV